MWNGSPLSWAGEVSMAPGKLNKHVVSNGIFMLGLNYEFSLQHQLYFEGAFKNFNKIKEDTLTGEMTPISNNGWGFREFFYKFQGKTTVLTVGLQSSTLGDLFLIDERVLGASLNRDFGKLSINARLGTVQKDFARMGDFCGTRKLLYMVKGSKAGDRLGETNLFGTVVSWNFNRQIASSNVNEFGGEDMSDDEFDEDLSDTGSTGNEFRGEALSGDDTNDNELGDDEFADDEFSDTEFSEFAPGKSFVDNAGLVLYSEFGPLYPSTKYFAGGIVQFLLPWGFNLGGEIIGQFDYQNNALMYFVELQRNFNWQSLGNTSVELGLITYTAIDANAIPNPSFSNMYIGEILRLDARDAPVFYVSFKHHFSYKVLRYFKIAYIKQISRHKFNEIDFELRIKLFNHLQIAPMFSCMDSAPLNEKITMLRAEFRLTF